MLCTCTDRPWGPPSLLYNEYRVSFPGARRPGRGVSHPPSYSAEVKERVEIYLYSPCSRVNLSKHVNLLVDSQARRDGYCP